MLKIKLVVMAIFLGVTGLIFVGSDHFSSEAKSDVLGEIANYKTWTKITERPIPVKLELSGAFTG